MIYNTFQRLCGKITKHKLRKIYLWSIGIDPPEYHYKCQICKKTFWNYNPPIEKQQSEIWKHENNRNI